MNAFQTQLLDLVRYTDYVATFADPSRQILDIDNYTYSVDANTLPANITNTAPRIFDTPMAGDNDFVLFYLSAFARVQGETALRVNPALTVQIVELSTARAFFSGPAPLPMVAGQGGFPFLLTGPKVIRARSTLRTTVKAAQPGAAFTGFYFCFHGSRIWYG